MMIAKLSLPRRTFLRGVGATLALPLLDAMVPALTAMSRTAAAPTRRLAFTYVPNGVILERWTPAADGAGFALPPILAPLDGHRDRIVVVSNLAMRTAEAAEGEGAGNHSRASAAWLSAVRPKKTEGADIRGGTTIDQMAANAIAQDTPLRSLEVAAMDFTAVGSCDVGYACTYSNTVSWRTPTAPLPMQTNPRVVFERLFGEVGRGIDARRRELAEDRSILDAIAGQVDSLQRGLGAADQARVRDYLESVREVEQRIQRMEQRVDADLALPDTPLGVPGSYDDHARVLYDLQALAFQTDVTRVSSIMLGKEASPQAYPHIGVPEAHHAVSHHGGKLNEVEMHAKINTYHISLFGQFLDRLQATPDGDGTLLDHTLLLYGSGMGNGDAHEHVPVPALLAGGAWGRLKGGRHIRNEEETPMANLLVSILEKTGLEVDSVGDSTGRLSDL